MEFHTLIIHFEDGDSVNIPKSCISHFFFEKVSESFIYIDNEMSIYKIADFISLGLNHMANKPSRTEKTYESPFDRILKKQDIVEFELLGYEESLAIHPHWDDANSRFNPYQKAKLINMEMDMEVTIWNRNKEE